MTRGLVNQKLRGINSKAWWPVTPYQKVGSPDNIIFHVDDINNFQMPGSYFQAFGRIVIGKGDLYSSKCGNNNCKPQFAELGFTGRSQTGEHWGKVLDWNEQCYSAGSGTWAAYHCRSGVGGD